MSEPVVTGRVMKRLGEQHGWTFYELDREQRHLLRWQVATKGKLYVGDVVSVWGSCPAEGVVYLARFEVVEAAA